MAYEPFITQCSSPVALLSRAGTTDLPKRHLGQLRGKGGQVGQGKAALCPTQWPLRSVMSQSLVKFEKMSEQ